MNEVTCLKCGGHKSEIEILGVGEFNQDVGRLFGLGFLAFICTCSEEIQYMILEADHPLLFNKTSYNMEFPSILSFNYPIDLDEVIDFSQELENISDIDEFLDKSSCPEKEGERKFLRRPLYRKSKLIELYNSINKTDQQRVLVITLDQDNYLRAWKLMGPGTRNNIDFSPKNIFRQAILLKNYTKVYVIDNLPINIQAPEREEIIKVNRLRQASAILGVDFIDRLHVDGDNFYSFKKLNLI
ncbi:MAG: JAB domain-containing protein [Bacillota bacterium]